MQAPIENTRKRTKQSFLCRMRTIKRWHRQPTWGSIITAVYRGTEVQFGQPICAALIVGERGVRLSSCFPMTVRARIQNMVLVFLP